MLLHKELSASFIGTAATKDDVAVIDVDELFLVVTRGIDTETALGK